MHPNLKIIPWAIVAAAMIAGVQTPAPVPPARSALERAYRANNTGVAWLERFDYTKAAASFRDALSVQPSLAIAHFNLSLALLYDNRLDSAEAEARAAAAGMRGAAGPDYVLGLIARAQGRGTAAVQAFTRAAQTDPQDAATQILLGQTRLQQGDAPGAVANLQAALNLEPYSATAAYNLSIALGRSGKADESKAMLVRFQSLREHGGTTLGSAYLEQGRYAQGIVSTGAEADLVDRRVPDVRFVGSGRVAPARAAADGAIALFDADADGDLDVVEATPGALRLWRNDASRLEANGTLAGPKAGPVVVVAGDYDNDGRADLLAAGPGAVALYRNRGTGAFANVTQASHLRAVNGDAPRAAAFVDIDHDGDLDVIVSGGVWRNNGDGTFADVTAASGVDARGATAIVPTDYDERRDVDLLVAGDRGLSLFRNLRDGSFRESAAAAGLAIAGRPAAIAAGDLNRDGRADFLITRSDGPAVLALSSSPAKYRIEAAPAAAARATAAATIDYDNDGLTDLLVVADNQLRLLRSVGSVWEDVSARALAGSQENQVLPEPGPGRAIAIGDLDGDGDDDIVLRTARGLTWLRNDGGNRAGALRLRLAARVSNRGGTGSRVEMRAGTLQVRRETYAVSPAPAPSDLVLGLGGRTSVDAVRVQWPAGIVQAELRPALTKTLTVTELDRKPSSCPYLFTWNGTRFQFLTDFLGGGELGYWLAPGVRGQPDPDEYVRIPSDALREKDGRYELRITNELEEVLYLDHLHLEAIAHPDGTGVYPNEGLLSPPFPPHALITVRDVRPLTAAVDGNGRDMALALRDVDRKFADGFTLSNLRGYAAPHALTLRLGSGDNDALLLTGWTDYAFSSDNVAASQRGLETSPPALQVRDARGRWRTVLADIGIPVGRPQTIVVDLRQPGLRGARELRIVTNMRIYWDRIAVATIDGRSDAAPARIDPSSAVLRWRGFSAEISPDGREPFTYNYGVVSTHSPWKTMPGAYTKEGGVLPALAAIDRQFVVMRPGDEVAVAFDARALPPLPAGWTRTFLLYANGFSREMDVNSESPDRVEPIPFHAGVFRPWRIVTTPLPSIDSLLVDAQRAR